MCVTSISHINCIGKEYSGCCQDEEGNKNTELGIEKPHLFVLKPQREGGGRSSDVIDVPLHSNVAFVWMCLKQIYLFEFQR